MMAAIVSGSGAAIAAAAIPLIEKLIIGYIMGVGFKLFAKAVGAELAFLVAIIAMMVGGYKAFQAGSISGAPWANNLLQAANGLFKAISANVQDDMRDLLGEYTAFNEYTDKVTKELETATKLLESNHLLTPYIVFGETPNNFYNRTIHAGNIGTLGIDAIHHHVAIALTLPKFNDTIGGNFT